MKLPSVAEYRKGLIVLGAVLVNILALGVLHGDVERYATLIVNILAAAGVIVVPNRPPLIAPPEPPVPPAKPLADPIPNPPQ